MKIRVFYRMRPNQIPEIICICLLYTSDAADE